MPTLDETRNPSRELEHRNPEATLYNEVIREKALTTDAVQGLLGRPMQTDLSSENIWVPLLNAPGALVPFIDMAFDFIQPVRHIYLQNNSAVTIYFEFDAPVKPGSLQLGAGRFMRGDLHVRTLHLMAFSTVLVNPAESAGIVLKGER